MFCIFKNKILRALVGIKLQKGNEEVGFKGCSQCKMAFLWAAFMTLSFTRIWTLDGIFLFDSGKTELREIAVIEKRGMKKGKLGKD